MTCEEFKKEIESTVWTIFGMERFYMNSSLKYSANCSFEVFSGRRTHSENEKNLVYDYRIAELFYNHRSVFYYNAKLKNERILLPMFEFMYEHASENELKKLLDKLKIMIIESL